MMRLLQEAIERAQSLPDQQQDAIGQLILDELEADCQWDTVLQKNPDKLRKLADAAWAEHLP